MLLEQTLALASPLLASPLLASPLLASPLQAAASLPPSQLPLLSLLPLTPQSLLLSAFVSALQDPCLLLPLPLRPAATGSAGLVLPSPVSSARPCAVLPGRLQASRK